LSELNLEFLRYDLYQKIEDYNLLVANIRFDEKLNSNVHFLMSLSINEIETEGKLRLQAEEAKQFMGGFTNKHCYIIKQREFTKRL
jgi:hypothetical protein